MMLLTGRNAPNLTCSAGRTFSAGSKPAMADLSPLQHTGIGALAGFLEVCIMQPTVGVKNALQQGRPIPWSPTVLYRGVAVNAGSMAPITAIQFGAHRVLDKMVTTATGKPLEGLNSILVATGAGALSASVGCPAELVMIQQQRTGRPLATEFSTILRERGLLKFYRGLGLTACRDGLYTAGYLGVSPVLQQLLAESSALQGASPTTVFVTAGMASGFLAALVTQPVDTIKTRVQAALDPAAAGENRSAWTALQHVRQTAGLSSLWAGFAPRALRIMGASIILQVVRSRVISFLEEPEHVGPDSKPVAS